VLSVRFGAKAKVRMPPFSDFAAYSHRRQQNDPISDSGDPFELPNAVRDIHPLVIGDANHRLGSSGTSDRLVPNIHSIRILVARSID